MANPAYKTTVPNVEATITTDKPIRQFWVEAYDSPGPVFFTVDGSAPGVGQDGSYALPTNGGSMEFDESRSRSVTVRFVSAHAALVAVRYR